MSLILRFCLVSHTSLYKSDLIFYAIILTTTLTYKDTQFHTCTLLTTETNLHYPGSKCDHHAESLREASIQLPGEPVTLFSIADDMMATKLHPFRAVEYKLVP